MFKLHERVGWVSTLALVLAWGALAGPSARWAASASGGEDLPLVPLLALGLGGLALVRAEPASWPSRAAAGPRPQPLALALLALATAATLAVERHLDLDLLSAAAAGLGTYALLGLYMAPGAWLRGLPVALVLVGALPFGAQADAFIGFPARLLLARLAGIGLGLMGLPVDGEGTVMQAMGRAAHVDLPCSGLKSLWTGALFFLAATWLEGRRPGLRWALAGATLAGCILGVNLLRVMAIVALDLHLGLEDLAAIVHAPLGVLGFALACGAGWLLLAACPAFAEAPTGPGPRPRPTVGLALAALLALGVATHTPRPLPPRAAEARVLSVPSGWVAEAEDLSPAEQDLFARHSASEAGKWRVQAEGVEGWLILVRSRSWRAHHPPDLCLQGQGLRPRAQRTVRVGEGFPLRLAEVAGAGLSASWFQAAHRTTDDHALRTFDALLRGPEEWVMASLLLELRADDHRLATLALALHDAIADALSRGDP